MNPLAELLKLLVVLISVVIIVPYAIGATLNTGIQLLLYYLNFQNAITRRFAESLTPDTASSVPLRDIFDVWFPLYIQPEAADVGLMVGYWVLGMLVVIITLDGILDKLEAIINLR